MARRGVQLGSDARVAVVGGGPAGTFFALSLLDIASREGRPAPEVTIFERKRFDVPGPRGCNYCAGVVQGSVLEKLGRLGVTVSPDMVHSEVQVYVYHAASGTLHVRPRRGRHAAISTYRGSGPAFAVNADVRSFDGMMLQAAVGRGARLVCGSVVDAQVPASPAGRPWLTWIADGGERHVEPFDLVVSACGLNCRMVAHQESLGFGYERPRTVRAFQAELPVPESFVEHLEGAVHVFGSSVPGLAFGALTPKRGFLTLSLVGWRDLCRADLWRFLEHADVRAFLPPGWKPPARLCMCRPRVSLSASRHPCADRFLVVGDANCSRLYKNGLDSACTTARYAAEAVLLQGVDRETLQRHYATRCQKDIVSDNRFGSLIFRASRFMARMPALEEVMVSVAGGQGVASSLQQEIMRGLFSGEVPYSSLLVKSLDPRLLGALMVACVRSRWKGAPVPAGAEGGSVAEPGAELEEVGTGVSASSGSAGPGA